MLWRKGARAWRAKGYSHTTAADAIEARFGTKRGLGRSRIAVLVTTKKEEIPPDVAAFIVEELPVLDAERWADHLRETAHEPPDAPGAAPETAPEPTRLDVDALGTGVAAKLPTLDVDALAAALADKLPSPPDADALAAALASRLPRPDVDALAAALSDKLPRPPDADALAAALADKLPKPPDADALAAALADKLPKAPDADELAAKVRKLAPWLGGNAVVFATGIACFAFLHCRHDARAMAHATSYWESKPVLKAADSSQMGERVPPEKYIPKGPWPEQKHEPCDAGLGETAINGGCWMTTGVKPPCGRLFRNADTCYRPVAADPQTPISGEAD